MLSAAAGTAFAYTVLHFCRWVVHATRRSVAADVEWRERHGGPQACKECSEVASPITASGRCWDCYGRVVGYEEYGAASWAKLVRVEEVVQKWLDQQGHDRCWYYPDVFREVADVLGLARKAPPMLPPLAEFREGCRRYQAEEYGTVGGLLLHRSAEPSPDYVEVAANALTPVGFAAMSVRVSGGCASALRARAADVERVLDAAASRLRGELEPCGECSRVGGVHTASCSEVRDMTDMAAPEMLCAEKEDSRYE